MNIISVREGLIVSVIITLLLSGCAYNRYKEAEMSRQNSLKEALSVEQKKKGELVLEQEKLRKEIVVWEAEKKDMQREIRAKEQEIVRLRKKNDTVTVVDAQLSKYNSDIRELKKKIANMEVQISKNRKLLADY